MTVPAICPPLPAAAVTEALGSLRVRLGTAYTATGIAAHLSAYARQQAAETRFIAALAGTSPAGGNFIFRATQFQEPQA